MDGLKAIPGKRKKRSKDLPPTPLQRGLRGALKCLPIGLVLVALVAIPLAVFHGFRHYYFEDNRDFFIEEKDIQITGNAMLTRDHILSILGLNGPTNALEIVSSDLAEKLRATPQVKGARVIFSQGVLRIEIEERTPVARIETSPPLVVDDEGVTFIYRSATRKNFPEISGFDLPDAEAGVRLPDETLCMLRLIKAQTYDECKLPSSIRSIALLGMNVDDGLRVTLRDGRKIDIAWEGMASEKRLSEPSEPMLRRLRNLKQTLNDSLLEGRTHFNAMAPSRVTISE